MKYTRKATLNLSILSLIVLVFVFAVSSCKPETVDNIVPPFVPAPEPNSYLFTSDVSATHAIGISPCPQDIANITVFCGRTNDSCTADSVVITNPHMGLDAQFINGRQSTTLSADTQSTSEELHIEFNCQVATTFTHKYKLIFYKDGIKVDEQDLKINMTVEQ